MIDLKKKKEKEWKGKDETIKWSVSLLCFEVFLAFQEKLSKKENAELKELSFALKKLSSKKGDNKFPKVAKFFLVEAGLRGVAAFVKMTSEENLNDLSKDGRNPLVHDGQLLTSLFPSEVIEDSNYYENTKKENNTFRSQISTAKEDYSQKEDQELTYDKCIEVLVSAHIDKKKLDDKFKKAYKKKLDDKFKKALIDSLNEVAPVPSQQTQQICC